MKKFNIIFAIVLMVSVLGQAQAQENPWVFGLGWNVIDDNGKPGMSDFDLHHSMNALPYPTALRIEKFLGYGMSFVVAASYNKYEGRKDINSDPFKGDSAVIHNSTVTAFDVGGKFGLMTIYDMNERVFNFSHQVFDPYIHIGAGYTTRDTRQVQNTPTANFGFGMNVVIWKGWGMNVDATGKLGISDFWTTPANYVQYTFSVIYRLQSDNGLEKQKRFE